MGILSYVKTLWQDRAVQTPNDYTKTNETSTTVTLVPKTGTVTQAGTPINAARLNNLENGVAGALPAGTVNSDIALLNAFILETDTRIVRLGYDTSGKIATVSEFDGVTLVALHTINRTNGLISSVSTNAGGKTVTWTFNRNTQQKIDNVTKTVV